MTSHPVLSDYNHLAALDRRPPSEPKPVVSVITVCRNAATTIQRCLESVRAQDFQDYEHIVIDGASTDGTAVLASAALRPQDLIVSEPDRGISDAMNKGIALARGCFIQFVHADDWLSRGQLRTGVEALCATEASYVFGDLVFFVNGKPAFLYKGDPDYTRSIDVRMPALNHPTVLARREAFERIGLFSLRYQCAMDYDWFMRLHRTGGVGMYRPDILGCMNHDGVSNVAFRRTMREVRDIAVAYGRNPFIAQGQYLYRINKTTIGRMVGAMCAPVHHWVRQLTNRSFHQLDAEVLRRTQI
jgi:glycosyltransferase